MKTKPDIGIIYPNYLPENFGEIITQDIAHEKLNLYLERQEPRIYSSLELAIPGIIAAYILKPYFESFLKEAGKDHYNLLKLSLSKLLKLNKNVPVELQTSNLTPNKLDNNNTQSKSISIHIEIKDGRIIKLLFDNQLEVEDWIMALEKILDLVLDNYMTESNDELSIKLESKGKNGSNEIFAIINKNTKKWQFLELRDLNENKDEKT